SSATSVIQTANPESGSPQIQLLLPAGILPLLCPSRQTQSAPAAWPPPAASLPASNLQLAPPDGTAAPRPSRSPCGTSRDLLPRARRADARDSQLLRLRC